MGEAARVSFGTAKAKDYRRGAQRKARTLTQRTRRKAENTEKDNGEPTAAGHRVAGRAGTESTLRAGGHFSVSCLIFNEVKNEKLQH